MSQRGLSRRAFALWALFLPTFLLTAPSARATIRYSVSLSDPEKHFFRVTMTIPDVHGEVVVAMPAWNALYQIRDFAHHVQDVRASNEGSRPLAVRKLDKQTWQITGEGTVSVRYATYWDDPGPFAAQLNSSHAFLNLAMILFYVPARRGEDARLGFEDVPPQWHLALALSAEEPGKVHDSRGYIAPNYDALVDAPVEAGEFEEWRLSESEDSPLSKVRVVVHGDAELSRAARAQFTDMLRRIASYETDLMRGAPFRSYTFIIHVGSASSGVGGGMEHANSTAIWIQTPDTLPGVAAHEFFHLWNVKRIRPVSLEPVDYAHEQWTRVLWFAEGVTNTYSAYTLVRTGIWSRRQFYDDLATQITELESRPARRWKSVEEASLDAWLEGHPLYRRSDLSISYYNKGQLLGVLLDMLIRDSTDNRASLDEVLRGLNEDFARPGRFYRDSEDIRSEAERVAGRSLTGFFARYVAGTDELPYADFLARAGLILKASGRSRAEFGFRAGRAPGGVVAVQLDAGSPAAQAGLRDGDVLLELDGAPFPHNPERWLRDHRRGQIVHLRLRRDGEEHEISFALGEQAEHVYFVEEGAEVSDKQRRIREGLLHGTTDPPR